MELEEMKVAWTTLSAQVERQKQLTDKLIMNMTQQRYRARLERLRRPEMIATVICIGMALLILFHFDRYDTPYLVVCGVISSLMLVLMPALSLVPIYRIGKLNLAEIPYKELVARYAKERRTFLAAQRLSFYLGFVLLITTLPVMVKVMGGNNTQIGSQFYGWALIGCFIAFAFFARRVYAYYVRSTSRLEDLLNELGE
jgi:hypothetical protein